jgi:hypothetical protein
MGRREDAETGRDIPVSPRPRVPSSPLPFSPSPLLPFPSSPRPLFSSFPLLPFSASPCPRVFFAASHDRGASLPHLRMYYW